MPVAMDEKRRMRGEEDRENTMKGGWGGGEERRIERTL